MYLRIRSPILFFFFSSRRRHTRCLSDWSSDVCSSDLQTLLENGLVDQLNFVVNPVMAGSGTTLFRPGKRTNLRLTSVTQRRNGVVIPIGKASGRERG